MSKDKEWLKNEINKLYPHPSDIYNHPDDITVLKVKLLDNVLELLDQLDEPETLSQEWISKNKESFHHFETNKVDYYVSADFLQNLLVPKQEEVDRAYKDGYEKGKEHAGEKEEEPETVARVILDYVLAEKRFKEVLGMEVKELEK